MGRRWCGCTCVQIDDKPDPTGYGGFRSGCAISTTTSTSSSTSGLGLSSSSSSFSSSPSSYSIPVFVPLVTAIEIFSFLYLSTGPHSTDPGPRGGSRGHLAAPTSVGSCFVFRPDRRHEVWRFVFYVFIHASWGHLSFNMVVQVLAGIPLEITHGSLRIFIIYFIGILAGSLSTSIFDRGAFLIGASGAVYSVMAAHLANIFLNYTEMELGLLKLAAVCTIAIADVGFSLWDQRSEVDRFSGPPVSYVAHLTGAAAGVVVGLLVLKRPKKKMSRSLATVQMTAFCLFAISMLFAVYWNVFVMEFVL